MTHLIPLPHRESLNEKEMQQRAATFLAHMRTRRSVRQFSSLPIPRQVITHCLQAAGTAPSGANQQPWHFVVVEDPTCKRRIRQAAEEVERAFYTTHAPEDWLEALAPLKTNASKPFLENAPILIVAFAQRYGLTPQGETIKHYYVPESIGIAIGMLITAIHHCGLVTLPYTPQPMHFLSQILDRPENERPVMILPVGHPKPDATIPVIERKPLEQYTTFI